MTLIATASFFALVTVGLPVAFVLLVISIMFVLNDPAMLPIIHVQRIISGTQSFPLLAIPLFILVGELANLSGVSRQVMGFASLATRPLYGGLAQANIVISTLMSGMSGSALGDTAMNAKILVPSMRRNGYPDGFSAAVTAASSLIAPMIPPGIGMILFGFVCDISVGRLFAGGVIPGAIMAVALMAVTSYVSRVRGYEPPQKRAPTADLLRAAVGIIPALVMPVIIVAGIRGGVFTPSESAAVAVVYVAFLCVIYRQAKFADYVKALRSTATTTSVIMLVLAASAGLGWILTFEQIPQKVGAGLLGVTQDPLLLLLIIGGLLLVCGMFIEGTPLILIFGPMFLPAVVTAGIDPVHYGVFFVFVVHLGGITPPVGTIMFTACAVIGVPISTFAKAVLPYIGVLLGIAVAIAAFPPLSTWLAYL
ncbi:TRAP transporter large permease [Pseudorhizobium flavum]|uniref:TRAP transporter large permease n=1 Tax=Pseudorhizobium flavum TaxID=1335061 RepID=UPI00376FD9E3